MQQFDWNKSFSSFQQYINDGDDDVAQHMISGMAGIEAMYSRTGIIQTLKDFLADHKVSYSDAMSVYAEDVQVKVDDLNKRFRKLNKLVKDSFDTDAIVKEAAMLPNHFNLVRPVDCTKEYEKLIAVFERMSDDEIKLNIDEANHIFNNDWNWIQAANVSNTMYASRMKK
jgi:hypothetical protein